MLMIEKALAMAGIKNNNNKNHHTPTIRVRGIEISASRIKIAV